MNNKVKTICTIGPASSSPEVFEKLVETGMDMVRLNFSHASNDQFTHVQKLIVENNGKHKKNVSLMMDLQGPRMRVGEMPKDGLELTENEIVIFSTDINKTSAIHINDPFLHEDIKPQHPMYLANGDIELLVINVKGTEIFTKVIRGGRLYSRKAVNVPETDLTTRGLTPKDIQDVEFGIKHGVDYIAMSFVKDAEDLQELKKHIAGSPVKIISKIEIRQALYNLDEIIKLSDLIMVARGDLGIEVPLEELPLIQKDIIKRTNIVHKPSIVATQMLVSMVNHHRPTRAEVSDVANAVFDGAEYLMLSDETAFGSYPVHALGYLVRTIRKAEQFQADKKQSDLYQSLRM